jgi:hypothetical protein
MKPPPVRQEQTTKIVDDHFSALEEVLDIIQKTYQPLQRTKNNAFKSWLAIRALESYRASSSPSIRSLPLDDAHPALKASFVAAYPPKHREHKDLITIDFGQFFAYGIGEESFAELSMKIESKISDLIQTDTFQAHWDANTTKFCSNEGSESQENTGCSEQYAEPGADMLSNPSLKAVFKAAQGFMVLMWMFEERQDILATFVQQIVVPMEATQPKVIRVRGRRE